MSKSKASIGKTTKLVLTSPLLLFRKFRRWKWDNFLGGLIFGAILSLVINVFTVSVQETLSRQRALEALEREVIGHRLVINSFVTEYDNFKNQDKSEIIMEYLATYSERFDTLVWESTDILRYVFELPTDVSGLVTLYYSSVLQPINKLLDVYEEDFKYVYDLKCNTTRNLFLNQPIDQELCYKLIDSQYETIAGMYAAVDEFTTDVTSKFHPTQDRLDSFWLKLLLGNNINEIFRRESNPTETN